MMAFILITSLLCACDAYSIQTAVLLWIAYGCCAP